MRKLEEQQVNSTHAHLTHNIINTSVEIDAALHNEEEDFTHLEELLLGALSDPKLPVLLHAKYELFLAVCPGRDSVGHVREAERAFVRIQ